MSDDSFERWWASYPRKVGKGKAREQFAKAIRKTTLEEMLAALQWQKTQPQWLANGGAFIPHPTTWLNQERWDDEPLEQPQVSGKTARILDAAARWARG